MNNGVILLSVLPKQYIFLKDWPVIMYDVEINLLTGSENYV